MVQRIVLTDDQRKALYEALENQQTYTQMADLIGVCVDTIKRILHREGIREFDGAKYAVSPANRLNRLNEEQWDRPCLKCRKQVPRPHGHYLCSKCDKSNKSQWAGVDEDWLVK
jgi:IS30 family transposase